MTSPQHRFSILQVWQVVGMIRGEVRTCFKSFMLSHPDPRNPETAAASVPLRLQKVGAGITASRTAAPDCCAATLKDHVAYGFFDYPEAILKRV
jgi:hypothetical protein